MDIEKLKAEFEQSECFKRLEHVAQYTFFEFGAYIKRTDVPADIEKKCGKLITALLFSWSAWKEAKAQAAPEGFVLVPKEPYAYLIKHKLWQKDSDPEIFLAVDFLSDDGVEKDKLTVCMPLYLGDDEAQEQAND